LEANRRNQRKKRNAGVLYTFNLIILLVFILVTNVHRFFHDDELATGNRKCTAVNPEENFSLPN